MNRKLFYMSILLTFTLFLTGCNQSVDELLGVAQDVIDELLGESDEAVSTDVEQTKQQENTNGNDQLGDSDNEGDDNIPAATDQALTSSLSESVTSFIEKQADKGYKLGKLPNGFPVDVPYHWALVDIPSDGNKDNYFEGIFCFDLPYEKDDLVEVFVNFNHLEYWHLGEGDGFFERTGFYTHEDTGRFPGSVNYFEDVNGGTCALMVIDFSGEGTGEPRYGEDPATMVGDQDPDYEGNKQSENDLEYAIVGDLIIPNFYPIIYEPRDVVRPDNYEQLKQDIRTSGLSNDDGTESIREKIRDGMVGIDHFSSGYPSVFPFEWYAVHFNEEPVNSDFEAKFCTDILTEQSILFHLNMIEQYDSNITKVEINDASKRDELAVVEYQFNDDYGTGSWSARSTFYVEETGDYSVHRCVDVDMMFDTLILK